MNTQIEIVNTARELQAGYRRIYDKTVDPRDADAIFFWSALFKLFKLLDSELTKTTKDSMNQQNEPTFHVDPSGLPNALVVPESQRLAGMNMGGAYERIAELEAKLKIATENVSQAVKERDEAMHVAGVACQDLADTEGELEQAVKERDELRERLAAAEAVCELLAKSYLVLPGELDRDLLKKWQEFKEKQ